MATKTTKTDAVLKLLGRQQGATVVHPTQSFLSLDVLVSAGLDHTPTERTHLPLAASDARPVLIGIACQATVCIEILVDTGLDHSAAEPLHLFATSRNDLLLYRRRGRPGHSRKFLDGSLGSAVAALMSPS